jgi:FemAB-related protein (PEP-CTERM system-associated)
MADYGGVCADNVEAENLLIKEAIKITQKYKAGYLELRHINAKDSASLYTKIHKQTFILDLCQDFSFLWNNFIPEIRNRIKKAQKSGLEIKIGGRELLDNFYFIYSFHMKELGTPVLGKVFFKNMCLKFPKNTKIFIVHHQGVLMGVALIIFFKDTIEVPWISSLGKYFPYCPNNLMYWEIIKYGCQQGFKYFDFGRSTKDSSHALFKTRWGARPVDLSWQYYSSNINRLPKISPDNPRFGLAINIWKKLPLLLTNSIGPKIARHLPY